MSLILTPSPGHAPADTSVHDRHLGARSPRDIMPPSPGGGPSTPSSRDHVRGPRCARRQAATHLPHWKIRTWRHHSPDTRPPIRRRDRDWMRLRRVKDHASQRLRRRDDEGPRREPHDPGTVSEVDGDDGKPRLAAPLPPPKSNGHRNIALPHARAASGCVTRKGVLEAVLHTRNARDAPRTRVQDLAREDPHRLLAELIPLLAMNIQVRGSRHDRHMVVARIHREAQESTPPGKWTDSATLMREDRERVSRIHGGSVGCDCRRKGLRARGTFHQGARVAGAVRARRRRSCRSRPLFPGIRHGGTVRARSAEFGAWSKPGTSLQSSAIPANGKAAPGQA